MKNVVRGVVKLVIMLGLIAGSVYIGRLAMPDIKLGLDLDGGVSITYQAATANPSAEQMGDSVYKLQLKAQDYSTEAEVYQEGSDKINIDIPGVNNANEILEELGKPGTLYFVEGNITWPLLATNSEVIDTATASDLDVSGHTGTEGANTAESMDLSGIQGVDVYQNPDGTVQIGGTPGDGATLLQSGSGNTATSSAIEDYPNYDYSKPPIFDESQIVITGNDVTSARGGMTQDSYGQTQYVVDLTFSDEGKEKFAVSTERNLNRPIYIIYNGEIL